MSSCVQNIHLCSNIDKYVGSMRFLLEEALWQEDPWWALEIGYVC